MARTKWLARLLPWVLVSKRTAGNRGFAPVSRLSVPPTLRVSVRGPAAGCLATIALCSWRSPTTRRPAKAEVNAIQAAGGWCGVLRPCWWAEDVLKVFFCYGECWGQ